MKSHRRATCVCLVMLCFLTAATVWAQPPTILEYSVPTAEASVHSITLGPDGNLWFTEVIGNGFSRVGRISTKGNVTEFPAFQFDAGNIIQGPDQNLWFGSIGRITPDGTISQYRVDGVAGMAQGPDRNIWFTLG